MIQQPSFGDHGFTGVWPEDVDARHAPHQTWTGFGLRQHIANAAGAIISPITGWFRRKVIRMLPLPSGRILEVGVGRGGGLAQYDHRSELAGTEANPRHIFKARQRIAARPLDHMAGLYRWSPDRLGFRDNAFDAITAFFLFKSARRPRAILNELARVTRPGGRVFVINRFQATNGVGRGRAIRWLARLTGVGRPLRADMLISDCDLDFVRERRADPLGLLRVLEFSKPA